MAEADRRVTALAVHESVVVAEPDYCVATKLTQPNLTE
jgi:hypothetical protein